MHTYSLFRLCVLSLVLLSFFLLSLYPYICPNRNTHIYFSYAYYLHSTSGLCVVVRRPLSYHEYSVPNCKCIVAAYPFPFSYRVGTFCAFHYLFSSYSQRYRLRFTHTICSLPNYSFFGHIHKGIKYPFSPCKLSFSLTHHLQQVAVSAQKSIPIATY